MKHKSGVRRKNFPIYCRKTISISLSAAAAVTQSGFRFFDMVEFHFFSAQISILFFYIFFSKEKESSK